MLHPIPPTEKSGGSSYVSGVTWVTPMNGRKSMGLPGVIAYNPTYMGVINLMRGPPCEDDDLCLRLKQGFLLFYIPFQGEHSRLFSGGGSQLC